MSIQDTRDIGWRDDATGLISGPPPDVQDCGCPTGQHQPSCPYGLVPDPEPQPTTVRADQLRPGMVVDGGNQAWHEVVATEPLDRGNGSAYVIILWRGGRTAEELPGKQYVLADEETAASWRAERDRDHTRLAVAASLRDLAARYQRGELPPPPRYGHLEVSYYLTAGSEVEAAAEALGTEVEHADNGATCTEAELGRLRLRLFAFDREAT